MTTYNVRYVYVNPHGAGPFKGKTTLTYKPNKGDEISAAFGRAVVTSVSKVKS